MGTIKINNYLSNLSIWIAISVSICSIYPWFIWYLPVNIFLPLLFVTIRIILYINHPHITKKQLASELSLFVFALVYCKFFIIEPRHNITEFILTIIPLSMMMLLRRTELKKFLYYLIISFSILLTISLIGFTLKTIGIELPYTLLTNPNPWYNPYKNYYLFTVYNDFGIFTRFTAMMQEPGHIGMACAIFLYITGYSLKKWYNIVMTISLVWTFSLAGYVLYVAGIVIQKILTNKNYIYSVIKISLFLLLLVLLTFFYYQTNRDSVISSLVLSRMEFDNSEGLSGNNRNTIDFEFEFSKFLKSNDALIGINYESFKKRWGGTGNSSYKNFILEKGLLSILLLLIFCIMYLKEYPSRIGAGLLILLTLSFIQRPYFLVPIQSFPFIASLYLFYYNDHKSLFFYE